MGYTHVLWDWNGTLLDDLSVSVDVLNAMLTARELSPLTAEEYREVFRFPIVDYYTAVGLSPERFPFDELARDYWRLYDPASRTAPLMTGAREVLSLLHGGGVRQAILSASEQGHLMAVTEYFGIRGFFDRVLGQDNIHGKSKVEAGLRWMAESGADPGEVVLIGDTAHDAQTAEAMGVDCLLIPNGHYSKGRLSPLGHPLLEDIRMVPGFLARLQTP